MAEYGAKSTAQGSTVGERAESLSSEVKRVEPSGEVGELPCVPGQRAARSGIDRDEPVQSTFEFSLSAGVGDAAVGSRRRVSNRGLAALALRCPVVTDK
jgi:hypothetical protein